MNCERQEQSCQKSSLVATLFSTADSIELGISGSFTSIEQLLSSIQSRLSKDLVGGLAAICLRTLNSLNQLLVKYKSAKQEDNQYKQRAVTLLSKLRGVVQSLTTSNDWSILPLGNFNSTLFKEVTNDLPKFTSLTPSKLGYALIKAMTALTKHADDLYQEIDVELSEQQKIWKDDLQLRETIAFYRKPLQRIPCILRCDEFYEGQALLTGEDYNVEYKDYYFPIQNMSILFTLKKTICSFMNKRGGTIVIGVHEDQKQQKWWIKGVWLYEFQVYELTKFFCDLRRKIYPRNPKPNRKPATEKQKIAEFEEDIYELTININSVEPIHGCDAAGRRLYLIRVDVPQGNPQELYHIYQQDSPDESKLRNPQYYVRNHHENTQIRSLLQVQEQLHRRLNK